MTLKATEEVKSRMYVQTQRFAEGLAGVCARAIGQIDAGINVSQLINDLLAQLRRAKSNAKDSSTWTAQQKTDLEAYAVSQGGDAGYIANYDDVVAKLNTAITQSITDIPVNGGGYTRYEKVSAQGVVTHDSAGALTSLRADLVALRTAIG